MNTQQLLSKLDADRRRIQVQRLVILLTLSRMALIRHSEESAMKNLSVVDALTLIRARSYVLTGSGVQPDRNP
jgi:hypothetical protein